LNKPVTLYEDETCLVIDKPAGLAVQGGVGVKASVDRLFPDCFLVHRLDRDTSGVLLLAKTRAAAAFYTGLFAAKKADGIQKVYAAVCACPTSGFPLEHEGRLDTTLVIKGRTLQASTGYSLIEEFDNEWGHFCRLELRLYTGRMHQIRRQLAKAGLPIAGDDKYGDFALNKTLRRSRPVGAGLHRLLLHAWRLVIPAELARPPYKPLAVEAPLPFEKAQETLPRQ
jgi:23S rRNA pseudouridine955/2504/2580 synthase